MKTNLRLAVVVALMIALLGMPSTAWGDSDSRVDRSGDAPSSIDVVRLDMFNDKRELSFKLHFADLRHRGRLAVSINFRRFTFDDLVFYELRIRRSPEGRTRVSVHLVDIGSDERIGCRRAKAQWKPRQDVLSASMPQGCAWGSKRRIAKAIVSERPYSGPMDRTGQVSAARG